jgi:hypothetical protein
MISIHLPVYVLILLLGTALIIPLAHKLTNLEIKIYMSYSLIIAPFSPYQHWYMYCKTVPMCIISGCGTQVSGLSSSLMNFQPQ